MKKLFFMVLMGVSASLMACGSSNEGDDNGGESIEFNSHKAALKKADSCDDYRKHILDAAAREIADARFGLHYHDWYEYDVSDDDYGDDYNGSPNSGGESGSGSSSVPKDEAGEFTVTNIQEEGVDELDTIKNDGNWMYNIVDRGIRVTRAWPAEDLEIVASLDPRGDMNDFYGKKDPNYVDDNSSYPVGLLLDGNRLIVVSSLYSWSDNDRGEYTVVAVYDVSDPTDPKFLHSHSLQGYLTDGRLINHRLHLVVADYTRWNMLDLDEDVYFGPIPGVPDYDWDDGNYDNWEAWEAKRREWLSHRKENTEKYLPVIRAWLEEKYPTIDEFTWPQYRSGSVKKDLISCSDLYIPSTTSSKDGLLVIADISGEDYKDVHAQAITDYGWLIYASKDNLYAISNSYDWYWDCYDDADSCQNRAHIHRFNIGKDDGKARYVNSGEVAGNIENQFWMSEYDGHIRVVSTENQWWGSDAGSLLSVLKLDGANMDVVGQVKDIGKGEQLYAARMFGPKGYVVTFERTDPLFTFDLSDPTNPKKMAELVINGFSRYIHKMDDNTILTIGENATDEGMTTGMQLQIFDVSDLAHPERIQHTMINKESDNEYGWSEALYDHHAFNYHAASGLLSIPVNLYNWSDDDYDHFTGAYIYKVSRDDGFTFLGGVNHADLVAPSCYGNWWTSMDRSRFYFKEAGKYDSGAYVYTMSSDGIKVNNALNPSENISTVRYYSHADEPLDCSDIDPYPEPYEEDECIDQNGDGVIDEDECEIYEIDPDPVKPSKE